MAVLKGIAAHYVMQADDRVSAMARQRELLAELVEPLLVDRARRAGPAVRRRLGGRRRRRRAARVVVDQVASLTDASAVAWHARLAGSSDQRYSAAVDIGSGAVGSRPALVEPQDPGVAVVGVEPYLPRSVVDDPVMMAA